MIKIEFIANGINDLSGNVLESGFVKFLDKYYKPKEVYSNIDGTILNSNTDGFYELDSNGSLDVYGDGIYNIQIFDSHKKTITTYKNLVYQNVMFLDDGVENRTIDGANINFVDVEVDDTLNLITEFEAMTNSKRSNADIHDALYKTGLTHGHRAFYNNELEFGSTDPVNITKRIGDFDPETGADGKGGIGQKETSHEQVVQHYGDFEIDCRNDEFGGALLVFSKYLIPEDGHTKIRITFPIVTGATRSFPNTFDDDFTGDLGTDVMIIEGINASGAKGIVLSFPEDNGGGDFMTHPSPSQFDPGYDGSSTYVSPIMYFGDTGQTGLPDTSPSHPTIRTSVPTAERGAYIEWDISAFDITHNIKIHLIEGINYKFYRNDDNPGIIVESLA